MVCANRRVSRLGYDGRRPGLQIPVAVAALLTLCAGEAQAAVTIANAATQNMTCSAGVCAPTAVDAVLSVADLESLLASGNIEVTTAGSGIEAHDILVHDAVSWSTANSLSLKAARDIRIDAGVSAEGLSAVALADTQLSFGTKGRIAFHHVASKLTINGAAYRLANTIHKLASLIASNPRGNYALATNYDASRDGTYGSPPIATAFAGTLEGLGNAIANLSIDDSAQGADLGLFTTIGTGGTVADLGLTHVNVVAGSLSSVGALVGDNEGTVRGDFVSGSVQDADDGFAGGLVGYSNSETMIACRSSAVVTGGMQGYAGGLLGRGGGLIAGSQASGAIAGGDGNWEGGLAGENDGQLKNSFATGPVAGTTQAFAGGLTGANLGSIENSHASGSTSGNGQPVSIGGLVGYNPGTITTSFATGAVTATGAYGANGGLVGYNPGTVTRSYASGTVTGDADGDVGGLIGLNGSNVSDSYATGAVSTTAASAYLGGLVGAALDNSVITDSYAMGTVTGGADDFIGGFVGELEGLSSIKSSYATGTVSGQSGSLVGGFVGTDGTKGEYLVHNYWDTDTSGVNRAAGNLRSDHGISGLSTVEFQSGLPVGFSAKVWNEDSGTNAGFPYLINNAPDRR